MSDAINSEILINSDIQGLHGVSLTVNSPIELSAAVEGYGQPTEGQINDEIEISAEAESFFGYYGSVDIMFEISAIGIGTSGFFGDLVSGFNPSVVAIGATGSSGIAASEFNPSLTAAGISGFEANIGADVPIEAVIDGEHSLGLAISAEFEIGCFALGLHGQDADIAGTVVITARGRGGYYTSEAAAPRFGHVDEVPILVSATAVGSVVNSIVTDITIDCDAQAIFIPPLLVLFGSRIFGQTGNFIRDGYIGDPPGYPLEIGFEATGVFGTIHRGTIASSVPITATASGRLLPRASLNSVIPIGFTAAGESTTINSLFGFVPIGVVSQGVSGNQDATISGQIVIGSNIVASTDIRRSQISATVAIQPNIQGSMRLNGFADVVIGISGLPSNRARSFLPNGEPVPQSFVHGSINNTIEITCEAVSESEVFAFVEASFEILAANSNLGQVLGRAGQIASTIIIQGFLSNTSTGVTVTKLVNNAVVYDIKEGIGVAKVSNLAVTSQPDTGIILGKSVVYAVIAPAVEEQLNSGYEAILFF